MVVAAVKRMNLSHVIGNAQTLILTESAVRQVFISFQLGGGAAAKLSDGRCEGEEGEREKRRG